MLFDFCFLSLLHLMVLSDAFWFIRVHSFIAQSSYLDKDLCIMSLFNGRHLLNSLTFLVSSLVISYLTIRSKCEHKYKDIWARNICFYFKKSLLKIEIICILLVY